MIRSCAVDWTTSFFEVWLILLLQGYCFIVLRSLWVTASSYRTPGSVEIIVISPHAYIHNYLRWFCISLSCSLAVMIGEAHITSISLKKGFRCSTHVRDMIENISLRHFISSLCCSLPYRSCSISCLCVLTISFVYLFTWRQSYKWARFFTRHILLKFPCNFLIFSLVVALSLLRW